MSMVTPTNDCQARHARRGLVALVLALMVAPAAADNVDTLLRQTSDSSEKVRLSATAALAKLGDARAIAIFAKLVVADPDKGVRAAAAVGLGRLVTSSTPPDVRSTVLGALGRAKSDVSELVRDEATKALLAISSAPSGGGGIFIDVGGMAAKAQGAEGYKGLMRKTAEKSLARVAKDMATTWPGGKSPSAADLGKRGMKGFHIDGTIVELQVKEQGAQALVSCKVSMLIATYPEKSMFGFLQGGAAVEAAYTEAEISLAKEDCIDAVVDDLVAKKIVPAIKTKAAQ